MNGIVMFFSRKEMDEIDGNRKETLEQLLRSVDCSETRRGIERGSGNPGAVP